MRKINSSDLLLVIDMQNAYLPGQPWACEGIEDTIAYIQQVIAQFPKNQILFTQYVPSKHPEGVWEEYNILNSQINADRWLNDYIEALKPYLNGNNLYQKSVYSCCGDEKIRSIIAGYKRVFVTGVVAECCVLSTVFDLIDMGKKVVYLKQGIAGESVRKANAVLEVLEGFSPLHVKFE